MKIFNQNGFVVFSELNLKPGGGIQIEYEKDGRWWTACIMPNLTTEEIQSPNNNQDWIYAVQFFGFVQEYQVRDNQVYWNYPVDFDGVPEQKTWKVRVTRSESGGANAVAEIHEVTLDMGNVVYLNNWLEWENVNPKTYSHLINWRVNDPTDVPTGWYRVSDDFGYPRLCAFGQGPLPPVSYNPHLSGTYDMYIGIREQLLECQFILPKGEKLDLLFSPRSLPITRFTKEVRLGNYEFVPDKPIQVALRPSTLVNKLRRFGDLFYIKLVPAAPRPAKKFDFVKPEQEIIFYAEPYSMCYYHYLQNEEQAELVASKYENLGVNKIISQTGRTGTVMMHYSKLAGWVKAQTEGDDRETSNGVMQALKHMDVMKELAKACHRHGIKYLANIGLNSPYIGGSLEAEWTKQHHDCIHPQHTLFLDFSRPEVVDYCAEQFKELMEDPDYDGISIEGCRYPYGQTAEQIIAVFRKIKEKVAPELRKKKEINFSIVADLPFFYQALETLLAEDLVDTVCVGRMMSLYPVVSLVNYKKLIAKYPGKKLYGKIDGWGYNYTDLNQGQLDRPEECEKLARSYYKDGADGLYFYQSEGILIDQFMQNFMKGVAPKPMIE